MTLLSFLLSCVLHYGCIYAITCSCRLRYVIPAALASVISWGVTFGLLWGNYGGL